MADGFCTEGWKFNFKGGNRPLRIWKNRSRGGSSHTVLVNSEGQAGSASCTKPSTTWARLVQQRLLACQFGCSSCLFEAQRSEHEIDHVPANLQLSKTVNRFQSHILRLGLVDFHPSNHISTLRCKNRQPFSEFTNMARIPSQNSHLSC